MRFLRYLLVYFILWIIPAHLFATILKGVIRDDYGDSIPFASILIKDSNKATSAGEDGSYFLQVPEGKVTLVVKVVGYRPYAQTVIAKGDTMTVDFLLKTEGETLAEVVIKANGEDPAYEIMRKVIAHKNKNSKKIQTLETDIYLKGKLYIRGLPDRLLGQTLSDSGKIALQKMFNLDSNNFGIVYLLEQFTHYYFKAPNKKFNEVKAIKTSGDPKGLGFATMPPITNVYQNNVQILDGVSPRGFISPANDLAFQYYRFKYLGSYMDDGIMIDKISFWPRRSKEPTFRGTLYVAEGDWAFQQLEWITDKNAQIDNVDTLKFSQQYRRTPEGNWIIQQQVLSPIIKMFGIEIAGGFLTNYNNSKINEPIADSIFKIKSISVYDKNSLKKDVDFWEKNRPIQLNIEEKENYKFKDSTFLVQKKREDSLFNSSQVNYDFILTGFSYKKRNTQIGTLPLLETIGYNTVEGFVLGLHPYWKEGIGNKDYIKIALPFHYGWNNKKMMATLNLEYKDSDSAFIGRQSTFWGTIGRDVFQINNTNPITPFLNTWTTLLDGNNFMKLYQAKKIQIGLNRNFGNGFYIGFDLNFEDRQALENSTFYSFVKKSKRKFTANNPDILPLFINHKAFIANFSLRYQPGWKFVDYPEYTMGIASKAPILELNYSKGIKGLWKTASDFDKWELGITQDIRMKMLGNLDYNIKAGGFLNKKFVGNPDMYHLMGNQIAIVNSYLGGFQTIPYFGYSSIPNTYTELHGQWHLNGLLTNKIPGFKQLNWYLVLTSNMMYNSNHDFYTEYGIGLENIGFKFMKFFRVDWFMGRGNKDMKWNNRFQIGSTIPLEQFNVK
ncbi:MAG TPA: DUF5686 and carboxypeptidase regulatory-like domain-containing protein [Edaphocola sp.]|nr:DUF5686 and carboxypeptidase regulatory-like domain-containing protein [Edaphocola sp.]